ncbi:hypothetical protein ACOSQ2_009016 [Xanthoceras sorbifolium]|uniref:Vinorine synthase-like n=1 Tax=Xanthoceras sorbifolium TaxID=99658 RepID=A0ABQ8ID12_9ROSI|nr:hypothetical protein JRO89_XS03G0315900 [Xanthoceras sorbifolium]
MEVRVISKNLIKPSVPTPNHLKTLKLSFIDQLAPAAFGSFIFYYPCNGDLTISDKEARLERLEKSLSDTLTLFYPLAGRYIEDGDSIDCNDEGAEYLEARVDGQLARFLEQNRDDQQLNRLIPFENEVVAFSQMVLAVQVNMFDCGGLAIGVCLSHKVADGFVIFSFIEGWARACKVGLEEVVCPSFDMGILLPAKDTDKFNIPVPEDDGAKMVTKRFVFNEGIISKLKAKVTAGVSAVKRHPSRVELVTALIWKARIRVAQAKHGHLRPSLLTLAYNFRGKTAIEIPKNAFGNLFKLVIARYEPTETRFEFPELVGLLGDAIRRTTVECSETESPDDLFSSAINSMREIHESLAKMEADICVFTSVCRFPYYEIDFGWGKPAWVSSVHKPSDIVLMMDTKCGTGVEAWVSLEKKDMLLFQQDHDIMSFTSKL